MLAWLVLACIGLEGLGWFGLTAVQEPLVKCFAFLSKELENGGKEMRIRRGANRGSGSEEI